MSEEEKIDLWKQPELKKAHDYLSKLADKPPENLEEETAKAVINEDKPKKWKSQQKIHEALCKLFKVKHDTDNWRIVKFSDNPDDLIKMDLRNLTFDIASQIDLLEEITKTEFSAQFSKLRSGLRKVIEEMECIDFQALSKEVDFELYISSKKDAVFDHQKFEQTLFSTALLAKLHRYSDFISDIERQRLKNRWRRKSKTKQPEIREREIALLILKVFEKNSIPLPESRENSEVSNGRFRKTLKHIFELFDLSREPKRAADEALAYFKNKF